MDDKAWLEQLLGIVTSVFDAYTAVLFIKDPHHPDAVEKSAGKGDGPDLVYAAGFSLGERLNNHARIKPGAGLIGWIAKKNEPLLINNFDPKKNRPGYYGAEEEFGVKAFMGRPLPKGRGVLCVDSKRTYSFSEKDQKILELFARFIDITADRIHDAAVGLSMARYTGGLKRLAELKANLTRWPEFLDQSLKLMAETAGFPFVFFLTLNEDGARYRLEGSHPPIVKADEEERLFPISAGMVGWVFKNGAPLFTQGGELQSSRQPLFGRDVGLPDVKTALVVPLVFSQKTRGAVCLASDKSEPVSQGLTDFVRMAGEYFSLFLENLHLRAKLHAQSRKG